MGTHFLSVLVITIPFHSCTNKPTNNLTINFSIDQSKKGHDYGIVSTNQRHQNNKLAKDYTLTGLPTICSSSDAQFYLDPMDKSCMNFYECSVGHVPILRTCPLGTRWSQSTLVCDHTANVHCQTELEERDTDADEKTTQTQTLGEINMVMSSPSPPSLRSEKSKKCKIEEGVMIYIANNLKTFFSSGQVECENSCASTDLCVAWTLRTSDHLCWLKSDDSLKGKKAGFITGTKACGGKPDCYEEDTDYPGNDLNPITGKTKDRRNSAAECQSLCYQTEECKFFTWESSNEHCWLKTEGVGQSSSGSISGPKVCVQWSGVQSRIWGDDQCKNVGNFINFKFGLQNCKNKCLEITTCTAINYNPGIKDCVLRGCTQPVEQPQSPFNDYRGYYIMVKNGGWSEWGEFSSCSASCGDAIKKRYRKKLCRNCQGLTEEIEYCDLDDCDETNVNKRSRVVRDVEKRVPSKGSCPIIIVKKEGKADFYFESTSKYDWMDGKKIYYSTDRTNFLYWKSHVWTFSEHISRNDTSGMDSAPVWRQMTDEDCWPKCGDKGGPCPSFCGVEGFCCRKTFKGCPEGAGEASPLIHTCVMETKTWPELLICFEEDTDYPGNDINGNDDLKNNEGECQALCSQTEKCKFFTWKKSTKQCWVKTDGGPGKDKTLKGYISGPRACDCFAQDTDYPSNDIKAVDSNSAAECQSVCSQTLHCKFFTWVQRNKNCWLKTAGGLGKEKYLEGAISGPRACGCYEENTEYDTQSINIGSTKDFRSSATECQVLCSFTERCKFFTWIQSTGHCWLKTVGGPGKGINKKGAISGPRVCAGNTNPLDADFKNHKIQLSCYERDIFHVSGISTEQETAKIGSSLFTDNEQARITQLPQDLKESTLFKSTFRTNQASIDISTVFWATIYVAIYFNFTIALGTDGGLPEVFYKDHWTKLDNTWFVEWDNLPNVDIADSSVDPNDLQRERLNQIWYKNINPGEVISFTPTVNDAIFAIFISKVYQDPVLPPVDCYEEDTNYPGNDINRITGKTKDRRNSAAECQSLCFRTVHCNYFTWVSSNHHCWLKTEGEGIFGEGDISGPKICGTSFTAAVKGCVFGHFGRSVYDVSLQDCKNLCLNETNFICNAIEYISKNRQGKRFCSLSTATKESEPDSWQQPCEGAWADMVYMERIRSINIFGYTETRTIVLNGGKWGEYLDKQMCTYPHFVTKMRLRFQDKSPGSYPDETGLNTIKLTCSDGLELEQRKLSDNEARKWNINWKEEKQCPDGVYMNGAMIRAETGAVDNSAANGLRFNCTDKSQLRPGDGIWGVWGEMQYCDEGSAIMGMQVQFEGPLGSNTSINDVRLFCAELPRGYLRTGNIILDGGKYGEYQKPQMCTYPHFVTKMRLRFQDENDLDNTGLNTIKLTCSDGFEIEQRKISEDDAQKFKIKWLEEKECPNGVYIRGAQIRGYGKKGKDSSSANGLRFECTDKTKHSPGDGLWGDWGQMKYCDEGSAIMGMRVQFEGPTIGENTGINDVHFYCAQLPKGIWSDPHDHVWGPLVCPLVEGQSVNEGVSLEECKEICELSEAKSPCTAIKYNSLGKGKHFNNCELQACPFPVPEPTFVKPNYKGYILLRHQVIEEFSLLGGNAGYMNHEDQCPYPHFAVKIEAKYVDSEKELKKREASYGITGLRITCSNNLIITAITPIEVVFSESWYEVGSCPAGSFINGIRTREAKRKRRSTSDAVLVLTAMAVLCTNRQNYFQNLFLDDMDGSTRPWKTCPPGSAINGIDTYINPALGIKDFATSCSLIKKKKNETCTAMDLEITQGVQLINEGQHKQGSEAYWEDWPWLVSISTSVGSELRTCSGTLVHCQYVLTALHCLMDSESSRPVHPNQISVFVKSTAMGEIPSGGGRKIKAQRVFYRDMMKFNIEKILEHRVPKYDIALIKLEEELNPYEIPPILLAETRMPDMKYELDPNGRVAGFKKTYYDPVHDKWVVPTFFQETSNLLFNYPCPKHSNDDIDLKYHICSQATNNETASTGNSGSPYMRVEKDGSGKDKWYLHGVVSTEASCNISWSGPHGVDVNVYDYLFLIYFAMYVSGGGTSMSPIKDLLAELVADYPFVIPGNV